MKPPVIIAWMLRGEPHCRNTSDKSMAVCVFHVDV